MRWAAAAALSLGIAAAADERDRLIEDLDRERTAFIRLLADWGGLTRYGSENSEIKLKPDEKRVVFLGDEITEQWGKGSAPFFPGKPYFNRGIARQTTPQMLVRFRQDVISLKPAAVVIQGGSNDFAGFAGPATTGTIAENIMTMTELAKAHGIRVVLASATPVCDCAGRNLTSTRTPGKLMGLNEWLRDYAAQSGAVYLDFWKALADGRYVRKELTADGLAPNDAGYSAMTPLAAAALDKALTAR